MFCEVKEGGRVEERAKRGRSEQGIVRGFELAWRGSEISVEVRTYDEDLSEIEDRCEESE